MLVAKRDEVAFDIILVVFVDMMDLRGTPLADRAAERALVQDVLLQGFRDRDSTSQDPPPEEAGFAASTM